LERHPKGGVVLETLEEPHLPNLTRLTCWRLCRPIRRSSFVTSGGVAARKLEVWRPEKFFDAGQKLRTIDADDGTGKAFAEGGTIPRADDSGIGNHHDASV